MDGMREAERDKVGSLLIQGAIVAVSLGAVVIFFVAVSYLLWQGVKLAYASSIVVGLVLAVLLQVAGMTWLVPRMGNFPSVTSGRSGESGMGPRRVLIAFASVAAVFLLTVVVTVVCGAPPKALWWMVR